jgi:flavin-binding protein dodecin
MQDYHTLITSPNIVGGSNISTIQHQKEAIERAQQSLQRAEEDLNAMRFLVY